MYVHKMKSVNVTNECECDLLSIVEWSCLFQGLFIFITNHKIEHLRVKTLHTYIHIFTTLSEVDDYLNHGNVLLLF